MTERENLLTRILKRLGLIVEYEVSKEDMCKQAQSICNHDCEYCAWRKEQDEMMVVSNKELDEVIRNLKAKIDAGKLQLTLVPTEAIEDIALVRMYGNAKYPEGGKDNWKTVEVERYRDALFRHLLAYINDPKGVDEESGIEHYKHLICNAAFICALERGDDAK